MSLTCPNCDQTLNQVDEEHWKCGDCEVRYTARYLGLQTAAEKVERAARPEAPLPVVLTGHALDFLEAWEPDHAPH